MSDRPVESNVVRGTKPPLGVLVTNLGTPDAPTPKALRRYLAEFLSDPRVVDLPRWIWWPLLHALVLPFRPRRSAAAYARIWTPEGSPLLINTLAISRTLETGLRAQLGKPVVIATGMRYGRPSLRGALDELLQAGSASIVVLPLYPQYARATVASTLAALAAARQTLSAPLNIHEISGYHAHPAYITALAASVREYWSRHARGGKLLISFHGIPQQTADRGDPYPQECRRTAELLAAELGLQPHDWMLCFQSRFGRAQWLQPYTQETLRGLAWQGVKTVDVICPGFAADCLETLEEIVLRYAESFRAAGGKELRYIPALNSRPDHIAALAQLVRTRFEQAHPAPASP